MSHDSIYSNPIAAVLKDGAGNYVMQRGAIESIVDAGGGLANITFTHDVHGGLATPTNYTFDATLLEVSGNGSTIICSLGANPDEVQIQTRNGAGALTELAYSLKVFEHNP